MHSIVFIVDLSGSMTEGAKLRIVANLIKAALQTLELGLRSDIVTDLRIVYITKQLEEFPISDDYEIPKPGASGGAFSDAVLADYLSTHYNDRDIFFLFSDTMHDTSAAKNVFTILVGDEVPSEKFTSNTYSAENFLPLWQFAAEGKSGVAS